MRRIFTLFIAAIMTASLFAQAPQKVSYQAVIRNSSDQLVTNQLVGMQISILQGSAAGTAVYVETQSPTTNDNGLITLEIGTGTTSDDFSAIDWTSGPYFIKTEIDPAGGTSYTISGTSQILSVPYALHAETAESITGVYSETDPVYVSSQAAYITATDITNLSNLSGTNTGDQDLSSYLTSESDPIYSASQAANITAADITNLSNLSGTNTGDQDLSSYLTSESDPVYSASQAANITAADITNLSNLSGTNTGDQDLSGYLTSESDPVYSAWDKDYADLINTPDLSCYLTSESDPVYSAWDKDYADLINTPDLSGYLTSESDPVYSAWDKDYADLINTPTAGAGIDITGNTVSESLYQVGDYAQGGVVFWVDETGEHGLVCAVVDQDGGSGIVWNYSSFTVTNAFGDGVYAGEMNTVLIIASQGGPSNTYAAGVCANLVLNNFGDWYLPSQYELDLMYTNKATIDITALANGGTAFANAEYWCSEAFAGDNVGAYYQLFTDGTQAYNPKSNTYRVRAIRAF